MPWAACCQPSRCPSWGSPAQQLRGAGRDAWAQVPVPPGASGQVLVPPGASGQVLVLPGAWAQEQAPRDA